MASPTESFVQQYLEQHPDAGLSEVRAQGMAQGLCGNAIARMFNKLCGPKDYPANGTFPEGDYIGQETHDASIPLETLHALKQAIARLGRERVHELVDILG